MSTYTRAAEIGDFVGRTIEGRSYSYGRPSRVSDFSWAPGTPSYYEEFVQGCDTRTLKSRAAWPLDVQHDKVEIGTVQFQRSTDDKEMLFTAEIAHGEAGDKLLAEIEDWNDVSVSFDSLRNVTRSTPHHGEIVGRAEIRLAGLSMAATGTGLVRDARVLLLRSTSTEAPRLQQIRRRLILL